MSADPLAVLAGPAATLRQTLAAVEALEGSGRPWREAAIGLSANVTIDLLGLYLRKHALLGGVRLKVAQGNFDDPEGDVERFRAAGVDQMLLLPFFDNLLPSFEAQVAHLPAEVLEAKEAEFRARMRMLFQRTAGFRALFLGSLHRFSSTVEPGGDRVDEVLARFNQALREDAAPFAQVRWVDTGASLLRVGQDHSFDPRFYFSAKAPYSAAFLDDLARRLVASARGFGSHFRKVLVLDGDNTLWGGVVGEDLLEGIQLDPHQAPGSIFWQAQNELLGMERRGVLLCLCSKNNPAEVAELLARHPAFVLRAEHFILQKVNWRDKVANLREIAQELDLGLDSLVFLDDSPFECEAVRAQLPEVCTFQVPARLSEYPAVLRRIKELFLAGGLAPDSRSKTGHYRQRAQAQDLKAEAPSQEAYLASLGLKVALTRDGAGQIRRISELSQKSNQFNLTTRRYTEGEIQSLMASPYHTVYALNVADRFGDAGLTGVLVMHWEGAHARVEAFFMSCRVIGRGVERAIWGVMLEDARRRGCAILAGEYRPTPRNGQVAAFFDGLGLTLVESAPDGARRYQAEIGSFAPPRTDWIEVSDVG